MKVIYDKVIFWILTLTVFTSIISKAGFNIFSVLFVIFSILIGLKRKENILKDKLFMAYFLCIFIGIFSNFITGGFEGVGEFLGNERSLFYFLAFILYNFSYKYFEFSKWSLIFGGLVSVIYSAISMITPNFLKNGYIFNDYKEISRLGSFHGVIRWGAFSQMLASSVGIFYKENSKIKMLPIGSFLLYFIFLLLTGTRAGFLGLIGASLTLILLLLFIEKIRISSKLTIIFVFIITTGFGIVNSHDYFRERVASILDLKNESNFVRIGFWKIGTDMIKENLIFGLGSNKILPKFENHIENSTQDYLEKYYPIRTGGPFENAYINLTLENGIIYTIPLYLLFITVLIKIIKETVKQPDKIKRLKVYFLLSTIIGNRIFCFFFPGTDSYQEFLVYYFLFYANSLTQNTISE